MNEHIKKDHSIGESAGAATGAVAGAKVGGSVAEAVNPTVYNDYFQSNYRSTPYYRSDREWSDYAPAYRYGYEGYKQYGGRKFDDIESDLERGWEKIKAESRLAWNEAREAVRDGWHYIERGLPGDADRDGR